MIKKLILQFGFCLILVFSGCTEKTINQIYTDSQEIFQIALPQTWENIGLDTFTPFSSNEDISQTMLQVVTHSTDKAALSEDDKQQILEKMDETKEKILIQKIREVKGIEAWEILGENKVYGNKLRKTHQVWLIHDGTLITFSLTASPEFYKSADKAFEKIIKNIKFLNKKF